MSSTIQAPSRSLLRSLKSTTCRCSRSKRISSSQQQRWISSDTSRVSQDQSRQPTSEPTQRPPRWASTPPAMKAPVRTRPYPVGWREFPVNGDPAKLDIVYTNFLGKNGSKMLADETKWLAVTHKSFDHGRRGFNDRLAYLGKFDTKSCDYGWNTDRRLNRAQDSRTTDQSRDAYGG